MRIIEAIATKNPCYKEGSKITVKGLMLHSIGTPQPSAKKLAENWNNSNANTCVHAVLEPSGDVYQVLPWEYRAWHCGSGPNGSGNNTHIGVEMSEPAHIQYRPNSAEYTDSNPAATKAHALATYQAAVELFAYLCKQYHLDPLADGVVISHSEGHRRGIASNHGDPEHIWSKCGLTMDEFRREVKAAMTVPAPEKNGEWAGVDKAKFIQELYIALFFRQADSGGFDFWMDQAGEGVSPAAIFDRFVHLPEGAERFTREIYARLLHREPDESGLTHWMKYIQDGGSIADMYQAIVNSDEYAGLWRSETVEIKSYP
jgi:hypothetical protein